MTDFKPYVGRKRTSGTGCISQINDHLFEGRYSLMWIDGKKRLQNVYAHTRKEKLKVLIEEMITEFAELKRQKAKETLPPRPQRSKRKEIKECEKPIKTTDMGTESPNPYR